MEEWVDGDSCRDWLGGVMKKHDGNVLRIVLESIDAIKYSQATIDLIERLTDGGRWDEDDVLSACYHISNLHEVMRRDIPDFKLWDSVLFIFEAICGNACAD